MGWTVYYAISRKTLMEPDESAMLDEILRKFNAQLHDECAPLFLELVPKDNIPGGLVFDSPKLDHFYYQGFTKVEYSKKPSSDFCIVVEAIKAAADAFPDFEVQIKDYYYILSSTPAKNVDPLKLIEQSPQSAILQKAISRMIR